MSFSKNNILPKFLINFGSIFFLNDLSAELQWDSVSDLYFLLEVSFKQYIYIYILLCVLLS